MNKERLKEMAQDKRFISGIYNYCDQWCERCTQTSRCLNQAMIEEEFTDPETQDIRNEAFWTKLSEIFKDTLDMLKERALSEGIDLDALDPDPSRTAEEAYRKVFPWRKGFSSTRFRSDGP